MGRSKTMKDLCKRRYNLNKPGKMTSSILCQAKTNFNTFSCGRNLVHQLTEYLIITFIMHDNDKLSIMKLIHPLLPKGIYDNGSIMMGTRTQVLSSNTCSKVRGNLNMMPVSTKDGVSIDKNLMYAH